MSNGATVDKPLPPRPVFETLPAACLCAVQQHGFDLTAINLARWAETYRCTPEQVAEAFKIALNGSRKLPEEVAANSPPVPESKEDEE